MSLPAQTGLHKRYIGDAVTVAFAYDWLLVDSQDLLVLIDGVATTAYTLTGLGIVTGGTVTFFVAPEVGAVIVFVRMMSVSQLLTLVLGGVFSSTSLEAALNRAVMLVQDVHERLSRIPMLDVSVADTLRNLDFPQGTAASPLIGWNAALDALTTYANSIDVQVISPAEGHSYGRVEVTLDAADFSGTGEMRATNALPANSTILGCPSSVTDDMDNSGGMTGYMVGDDLITDRWGTSSALTTGTVLGDGNFPTGSAERTCNSATDLVVRSVGGVFGGSGTIFLVVHYRQLRTS